MKAIARNYKGIEFISVSELPTNQQLLLQLNQEPERIKILLDGKLVGNCIQYTEYERWYSSVYRRSIAYSEVKPTQEEVYQVTLSLHKA